MNKNVRTVIVVGVLAVGAYLLYKWYMNRQAAASTGQGAVSQLGSNLNSLAPELVGGSSGPSSGPQVTMPVNITLTETKPVGGEGINGGGGQPDTFGAQPMLAGANNSPLTAQMQTATDGTPGENPDNALITDDQENPGSL